MWADGLDNPIFLVESEIDKSTSVFDTRISLTYLTYLIDSVHRVNFYPRASFTKNDHSFRKMAPLSIRGWPPTIRGAPNCRALFEYQGSSDYQESSQLSGPSK